MVSGRRYNYLYACGTRKAILDTLYKVNVQTGEVLAWYEEGSYPSAPVFVPHPDQESEDHGVVLSLMVTTGPERYAFMLILDAQSFLEVARAKVNVKLGKTGHGLFRQETS